MGDKGGKKNTNKKQRQAKEKQEQKRRDRVAKQPKVISITGANRQLA